MENARDGILHFGFTGNWQAGAFLTFISKNHFNTLIHFMLIVNVEQKFQPKDATRKFITRFNAIMELTRKEVSG